MSDYTKLVNFASKDALPTGNALKVIQGTEIDEEFTAIATAVSSKANLLSAQLTGVPVAPTAAVATNTTQVATTAYVMAQIALTEATAAAGTGTALPLAGGTMTGDTDHGDDIKAKFGDGDDLQIYHDGTHSFIKDEGTGNLILRTNGAAIELGAGGEALATFTKDGAVDLFHNNVKKLETTAAGVSVTGALTATGDITAFSDERLKSDIETIPDALEKILSIRGVTFDMNGRRGTGVIAQDLEQVLPEAVHDNEETELKSVAYGNVVGLLIEAIKEQQRQIDNLMYLVGD